MSNDSSQPPEEELDPIVLTDVVSIATATGGTRGKGSRTAVATTAAVAVAVAVIGAGTYLGTQNHSTHNSTVDAAGVAATASITTTPVAGGGDYDVFIAAAGGDEIATLNSQTGTPGLTYKSDSAMGIALTPNDQTLYVANTGQYGVLSVNVATRAETTIQVGAYPQDVAVSPSGATVYATLTGGDTGPGGSNQVAVIDTATNTLTGKITVGSAPRQIVLSTDGSRAYVSTDQGIYVIDTATNQVAGVVKAPTDVQGLALSPDGSTLYATAPDEDEVLQILTRNLHVGRPYKAGAEPWSVGVSTDGTKLYVADTNSNSVAVIDTQNGHTLANVTVGSLPTAIGVTPDGSEVWVANTLTGSLSVISTASNTLAATIPGGPGTSALDSAPTDIVFAPAS